MPTPRPIDVPRRRLLRAALLASLVAGKAAPAATEPWRAALAQVQLIGAGEMTWFGLRIYHASLWAPQRPFDPGAPFALQLRYYRSISRERLVGTSMDEIERLHAPPLDAATRIRWEAALGAGFVDVRAGDELTGVYLPGRGMRLYDRARLLAEIADESLARAFFDIWLHPDTHDPALRRRLIGAQP